MLNLKLKENIKKYKEGSKINLFTNLGNIYGIVLGYNDDFIKIHLIENGEIINLQYSDILYI